MKRSRPRWLKFLFTNLNHSQWGSHNAHYNFFCKDSGVEICTLWLFFLPKNGLISFETGSPTNCPHNQSFPFHREGWVWELLPPLKSNIDAKNDGLDNVAPFRYGYFVYLCKVGGGPFCCLYFNPTSYEPTSFLVTAEFRVFCHGKIFARRCMCVIRIKNYSAPGRKKTTCAKGLLLFGVWCSRTSHGWLTIRFKIWEVNLKFWNPNRIKQPSF